MKPAILIILFSLFGIYSYSQGMIGLQGGIGQTTSDQTNFHAKTPATFGVQYLKIITPDISFGCSVFYEHYSLIYNNNDNSFQGTIIQDCAYLFLTPRIDIGIDHKQYVHWFLSLGPGILVSGSQTTSYGYYTNSGGNFNYTYESNNTSDKINHFVFRIGTGITEHIRITKELHITFSEEFGFLPTAISKNL